MNEVLAALLGATLAGIIPFFVGRHDKKNKREALLKAVAAEVATLCEFIRLQAYPQNYAIAAAIVACGGEAEMMPIDANQKYFVIYESIASELGTLSGQQAGQIARFYTLLKIAMDTAHPKSIFPATEKNLKFMHVLSIEILRVGDTIVQFPANSIDFGALR